MHSVIRGDDKFDSANGSPNATVGAVGTYALLDVPQQDGFPHNVIWPTMPA